jgi:hypothetical protein
MTTFDTPPQRQARSTGPRPQDVLAEEASRRAVPDVLLTDSPAYFGTDDLPKQRYLSRGYHDREVAKMWSKMWQMACREETAVGKVFSDARTFKVDRDRPELRKHVTFGMGVHSCLGAALARQDAEAAVKAVAG